MNLAKPLIALILAVVTVAAALAPAAQSTAEDRPDGLNAVLNVADFAMAHPARFGDGPTMVAAREFLVEELEGYGLEVVEQRYNFGTNILAMKRGTERPHDWVVVSAHYDSVAQVGGGGGFLETVFGAWDNGAGVAALLEMARVASDREWENTLVFAFFDDEEIGLVGSSRFVNHYDGLAWEGGNVRLVANINADPPGLNWPCVVNEVAMPVTFMDTHTLGAGQALLKQFMYDAKDAAGVPDHAFEYYRGGVPAFGVFSGTSDNARFGAKGIPSMYIGSTVHLGLATGNSVPTLYPLHTPADSLSTMLSYCPLPVLAQGFGVAMDIVWDTLLSIDGYGAAFPRP